MACRAGSVPKMSEVLQRLLKGNAIGLNRILTMAAHTPMIAAGSKAERITGMLGGVVDPGVSKMP
jgi:hypothetical protein